MTEIDWADVIDRMFDELVDIWHNDGCSSFYAQPEIYEFMDLTEEEYAAIVERQHVKDLPT